MHIDVDYIVVDVNGIGYRLFCSHPQRFSGIDEEQTIYTHHHVRDDAIFLFGFATRDEQALFRKLIEVSGIGPRVANGILSGSDPKALISAILTENIAYLTKLPGVGKKTAQRLILDLKDKLKPFSDMMHEQPAATQYPEALHTDSALEMRFVEAKQGLLGLGYTEAECDQVLSDMKSKVKESDSVDAIIRIALRSLYRG